MRAYLLLLMLVLLSVNANASWQSYQSDLMNTGISNETGYFPLKTANFSSNEMGMNFQVLIDDIDANGNKEIVLFSNDSLIILSPKLEILSHAKIGAVRGQPALFNFGDDGLIKIIFNSRQNSTDYFFVYTYDNSSLQQKFNLTLANEANFSGIKCANINGSNLCIFKDRMNYVNVINLDSKANETYKVSNNNERRQTVPAIGDIDNDGNLDAVFWLNDDDDNGYGLLAFDLGSRSIKWKVNNIFAPFILQGGIEYFELYKLKGQPVLVDLDNDKKLEIAVSVFYDDSKNYEMTADWFTELIVYNYNGSKLFSKCEIYPLNDFSGCGSTGDTQLDKWEGTNPFVLDYDKNGIDDICFVKDVKKTVGIIGFDYMALNCYNYTGKEIAKVKLSDFPDGIISTAATADMNGDGEKEIIISHDVYLLNGTSIFNIAGVSTYFPVPADLDGNKGIDLIWTKGSQIKAFLDNTNYTIDLAVYADDINFYKFNETYVNATAIIRNVGEVEADNVKAAVYNAETLENNTASVNIRKNSNFTFSAVLELDKNENVWINVDYDNEINETDESNNFALKEFLGLPKVYVSSDAEPSSINSDFRDYIKNKLASGYYTEKEGEADVLVYIGKRNPRNQDNNVNYLDKHEIGYDSGNIIYNDEIGNNPYSGLVFGVFDDDLFSNGKFTIMIAGNDIEGEIASVKEFINNQEIFLNNKDKESIFIDDENADAVKVWDYLHLGGNAEHYKENSEEFRKIVRNALNDEMFNVFDKEVISDGITLRLRNLKPNISGDYLEYLNSTGVPVEMPVVLAHGLFSNLTTWEVLGAELSNVGRDTWLIEITGGPGQDCNDCIDYSFYNLTDIFVPALLNGVLNFTNKDKIQYVGFSNGCRAALDSLERNKFDSNKVETFVAVGCPGAFEGFDIGASGIRLLDNRINGNIGNRKHIGIGEMFIAGVLGANSISLNEEKISVNLWRQYNTWINSSDDKQPGSTKLTNFAIIHGNAGGTSDGIVSLTDEKGIYDNVNISKSKMRFNIFATHIGLDNRPATKQLIKKSINNEKLNFLERNIYLKESNITSN